jgi:hypothetical protein
MSRSCNITNMRVYMLNLRLLYCISESNEVLPGGVGAERRVHEVVRLRTLSIALQHKKEIVKKSSDCSCGLCDARAENCQVQCKKIRIYFDKREKNTRDPLFGVFF